MSTGKRKAQKNKRKVFISCSGDKSKKMAAVLRAWLPKVLYKVKPWTSELDADLGEEWPDKVSSELQEAEFGIICFTPENLYEPWLLYEAGALAKKKEGRKVMICPLLHGLKPRNIKGPLGRIQSKIFNEEGLESLVVVMNRELKLGYEHREIKKNFKAALPGLRRGLMQINDSRAYMLDRAKIKLIRTISQVKATGLLEDHNYLSYIISASLNSRTRRLDNLMVDSLYYHLPYTLYPIYMIKLLRYFKGISVSAIAIVDKEESFWRGTGLSENIIRYTPPNSTRVFVLDSRKMLRDIWPHLIPHGKKYKVKLMSKSALDSVTRSCNYDFSIFKDDKTSLLARYYEDNVSNLKEIRFSSVDEEVEEHEGALKSILNSRDVHPFRSNGQTRLINEMFPDEK